MVSDEQLNETVRRYLKDQTPEEQMERVAETYKTEKRIQKRRSKLLKIAGIVVAIVVAITLGD